MKPSRPAGQRRWRPRGPRAPSPGGSSRRSQLGGGFWRRAEEAPRSRSPRLGIPSPSLGPKPALLCRLRCSRASPAPYSQASLLQRNSRRCIAPAGDLLATTRSRRNLPAPPVYERGSFSSFFLEHLAVSFQLFVLLVTDRFQLQALQDSRRTPGWCV